MLDKIVDDLKNVFRKEKVSIGYQWERKGGEILALSPSDFNKTIIDNLPTEEDNCAFRMMSLNEWDVVRQTGVIGGQRVVGQLEPGVTWWGDQVGDATSQIGGSIHVMDNGKTTWGGERGVLVAMDKKVVLAAAVEKRKSGAGREFNAYKTKKPIESRNVKAVFLVNKDRSSGCFALHQLKSRQVIL